MQFHHHHHHHHHSSSDDEDGPGRYPPAGTSIPRPCYDHPPPPQPLAGEGFYPPTSYPPPAPAVPQHYPAYPPHHPSFVYPGNVVPPELLGRPTFKVYCKAGPGFALTVRDGRVVLAYSNPTDPHQHWYMDEKYSAMVKDEEGSPGFALVNQATGLAIKHSFGASHPVQLIPYDPEHLDESVLWAMSRDFGYGYRTIRMINNIRLNVDAFHGDNKSGGVYDGMSIVLWPWNKGDNQLWRIAPYV
ncbi:hypothetical protein MLD38_030927 [Melastoma candidum]|uniref:Uncharacterized protein n=1 Tax=Melastoma candidum TaxID=119954 RepID=A0ACB9MML9_9MYRT|nr:hypothetical protein MLD38_030927 [Melastoma candidum]